MPKKIRAKSSTLLRRVLLILCGTILGVSVYMINASKVVGNTFPMPFGSGAGVVLTGSMEPELSVYDLIIAKKTADYTVGDVVVFQDGRSMVVHRIVAMDERAGMVQTKGDANNAADMPIPLDAVKGKVIAHAAGVGLLVHMAKTPVGIAVILAAAFLLMEFSFRKEKEQDEDELEEIRREIKRLKEDKE